MRRDLPYALSGLALGVLLLGNAALAPDAAPVRVVDVALVLVMAAALAVCRRHPVVALVVVTAAMLALHVRVHSGVSAAFPVLGAVYLAAWRGHRSAAVLASLVFLGGFLARDVSVAPAGRPGQQIAERTALLLGWFVAANVAGLVARQHRAYLEQVEQRAVEAERTREEVALRRAGEERLRIARDLHDSLTHNISVIKVQTGIAVHLARKHGEEPSATLLAIQEASSAAMRELRATLDVLRAPSDEDPVGLARVDDLARRTRAAGVPVQVTVTGEPPDLPAEVDQAGYRIVQEALTNVARHAQASEVSVVLSQRADGTAVVVEDNGRGFDVEAAACAGRLGLAGMRERAELRGGSLTIESRPGQGTAIYVEIPCPPHPPAPPAAA